MTKYQRRKCARRLHQAQQALLKVNGWLTAGAEAIHGTDMAYRVRGLSIASGRLLAEVENVQEILQKEALKQRNDERKTLAENAS